MGHEEQSTSPDWIQETRLRGTSSRQVENIQIRHSPFAGSLVPAKFARTVDHPALVSKHQESRNLLTNGSRAAVWYRQQKLRSKLLFFMHGGRSSSETPVHDQHERPKAQNRNSKGERPVVTRCVCVRGAYT